MKQDTLFGVAAVIVVIACVLGGVYFLTPKPNLAGAPLNILPTLTNSSYACGSGSSVMFTANSSRDFLEISNLDTTTSAGNAAAWLCFGPTCSVKTGVEVMQGTTYKMNSGTPYIGPISCIANGADGSFLSYIVNQ